MKRENIIPVLWLMMAAIIVGASVGFSIRADADPVDEAALAVCNYYDAVGPTRGGTLRIAQQMFDAGLSTDEAGDMFAVAVTAYCPEYLRPVMAIMDDLSEGR